MKTGFRDLSVVARIGIIGGWISLITYILSFLVGFVLGILEVA